VNEATFGAPLSASRPRAVPHPRVLLALLALLGLRVAFWLVAPPNSDEAYYWLWGLHPALSYLDHPPLHAWIQGAFHALLGQSLLVLRLPAALTTVATVVLVARLAGRISGARHSPIVTVAAVVLASPLLLMFTSFAWQDHLLIFLVLASTSLFLDVLAAAAAGVRAPTWKILGAGLTLGLAGITKYNAVFLAVGYGGVLATEPGARRLLRDPRVWAALALCLATLTPVLLWNVEHGFASFRFQTADRMHYRFLGPNGVLHFLGPSLLFLSPVLAWAMAAGVRRQGWARAPSGAALRRLALLVFAASTATFLALSLFTWVIYYWNVVAYLLLLPPAVVWLAERPRVLRWHLGYGLVLAAGMVVHGTLLPLSALAPSVKDEDSKEVYGWDAVAAAVREEARPGERPLAGDYRPASHLDWALGGPATAVLGLPSAFDDWPSSQLRPGEAAIVVGDPRERFIDEARCRFERMTLLRKVPVVRLGLKLKEYELWRGEGFRGAHGRAICGPAEATVSPAAARSLP
jgi:4-amino-4-deoxy-L-arabinose transferase-like glycosyltransferase